MAEVTFKISYWYYQQEIFRRHLRPCNGLHVTVHSTLSVYYYYYYLYLWLLCSGYDFCYYVVCWITVEEWCKPHLLSVSCFYFVVMPTMQHWMLCYNLMNEDPWVVLNISVVHRLLGHFVCISFFMFLCHNLSTGCEWIFEYKIWGSDFLGFRKKAVLFWGGLHDWELYAPFNFCFHEPKCSNSVHF